ncbi:MAG TPA: cytochrome c [Ideonella sp.]|nr:cytochrome c [Ideonella sp.]
MKPWIKRSALGVVGLVAAAAATLVAGVQLGERKMQRHIEVAARPVALRSDAASVERGRYLFMSRGCVECHGADGGGKEVVSDGKGLRVVAPNIAPGPRGVVSAYAAADWERTIRHGVKPDGRPLIVMPSEDYNRLTDDDLASVVAFVRQLPPVQGEAAAIELPAVVKALYAAGLMKDSAEKIDHRLPPSTPVPEAVTPAHGAYVANACLGCHGMALQGGKIPGAPPDWPAAARLAPGDGSVMPRYADAQAFTAMLRSGKRPDGSEVSKVMPFISLQAMSDTDVQALYLHLKSLPAPSAGKS